MRRLSPPQAAPGFAPLLRAGLQSVGVAFLSLDHVRRAKKGLSSKRELVEWWKALYDLVLVVLADFDVDADELQRMNSGAALQSVLEDPALHERRMEIVRYYLYDWGFVCTSFYCAQDAVSSRVLLLSFAWLLSYAQFFERQQEPILNILLGDMQPPILPPYPNDVVLPAETISEASKATLDSLAQWSEPSLCETQSPELVFSARIHQLHAAFGRLRHHMNELESYQRYHKRLLQRLDETQGKPEDHKDELLPASVLQLLTLAKPKLDAHLRRLSLRIQMVEHEKLFYKWVNGLLVSPAAALSPELLERPQRSSDSDTQLAIVRKEVASARAVFEASQAVHQQLRCNYEQQMLEWKQRKKSRAQSEQMDMRMQKVAHDIRTKETFDPQRLFLQSARTWEQPRSRVNMTEEESIPMNEDLVRLRSQLEQVLQEITRDYCRLELI